MYVLVFEFKRGMELVFLVGLLCTILPVVNGVDFDPEPDKWIQGEYGSFSCSNSLSVIVNKNGNEVIRCTTDGSNFCPTPAPSYAKVTTTGNTLNFTILNVSRARDTANWECGGTTTKIDVKIPLPSATIENKNSLTFTDGQTTSITCKTGVSYPPATITWSIGGTNKGGATTTNNQDNTTTSIYQYKADKTDHNKILQCSATNGFPEPTSTKSDSMTLNIRFPVPSATIENKNSLTFADGKTTSITFNIGVSYPPATITWSIGGTNINGATSTNNPDGTTTSILLYKADITDHNKTLQCSAFNGFGSPKSESLTLNITSAPKIIDGLGTQDCFSVAVTVYSNPQPKCEWLFNGQASDETFTIVSDGYQHTCKLSSYSNPRDIPSGDYYVNISNARGWTSRTINIPQIKDPFPDYLLAVQIIHIVAVFLVFLVISCSDRGEKFMQGVSIASVVLIVVCMGLLIYLLVKLQEEAWIVTSSLMIVFTVLTAVIIILINRISILTKIKDEHWYVGLVVSCVITILFSLAALIYLVVTLSQYDVCKEEYLGAGVGFQAVDVLVIALLLVTVLKMKTGSGTSRSITPDSNSPNRKLIAQQQQDQQGKGMQGRGAGKTHQSKMGEGEKGMEKQREGGKTGTDKTRQSKKGEGMEKQREGGKGADKTLQGKKGEGEKKVEEEKKKIEGKGKEGEGKKGEGGKKEEGEKVKKKKSHKREKKKSEGDEIELENKTNSASPVQVPPSRPLPQPSTHLTNLPPIRGQIRN